MADAVGAWATDSERNPKHVFSIGPTVSSGRPALSINEVAPMRAYRKPVPIEAASPAKLAAMFNVRDADLAKAIDQGLPVFMVGVRRRILVDDFKLYFRTLPRATKQRKVVPHGD
jgi:predicted PhzF superfamily epimerase YddE/YHI9